MADELKPVLLSLDLGLDMTTPKPATASGSLLSCMNYERGAASGMSRIEGYEYYDAQTSVDTTSFKIIDLSTTHNLVVGAHVGTLETYYGQVGVIESLLKHTAVDSDKLLAVKGVGVPDDSLRHGAAVYGVLEDVSRSRTVHVGTVVEIVSPTRIVIAITNSEPLVVGKILYGLDVEGGEHYSNGTMAAIIEFNTVVYNIASNYNYRRQYATTLRNSITSIQDPAGLLWLNDVLYAVGVKTDITEASVGTFYKCRTVQQLLDDSSGAEKVIGWQELDLGTSLQDFPIIGPQEAVNALPTIKGLEIAESKYEFIVANFYGSENTTRAYGVSGDSKAFEFDGKNFYFIPTGLPFDLDRPRHIAQFKDRLFLAYPNGSILYSVVGEPRNFDGVMGAGEIAFGDRVVGLQVISGEALAVFCENSIHYIGADLSTHNISPNTGAIEYTVTATNKPFYCSANGIMTLEQSDKYGEFVGQSISEKVEPWLRPRLRRVQGRQTAQPSVVGVTIVRSKNQYRVFFRDGYVLTLTATSQGYVFTTQKYSYTSGTFITFASCSQMSSDGTERLFAAHHDPAQPSLDKVVEVDAGWGFAGVPVEYYFETNAYYDSPFTYNRISKIRLHGQSKGLASLKVQTSSTMDAFEEDYNITQDQHLSLPRKTALYRDDLTYTTDIKDLADRGLGFKLKISGRVTDVTEPPHVCQLITTLNKTGGKLDV